MDENPLKVLEHKIRAKLDSAIAENNEKKIKELRDDFRAFSRTMERAYPVMKNKVRELRERRMQARAAGEITQAEFERLGKEHTKIAQDLWYKKTIEYLPEKIKRKILREAAVRARWSKYGPDGDLYGGRRTRRTKTKNSKSKSKSKSKKSHKKTSKRNTRKSRK